MRLSQREREREREREIERESVCVHLCVCVEGGGWMGWGRGALSHVCAHNYVCILVCIHIYITQVSCFGHTTSCAVTCAVDWRWASFEM